MKQVAEQALHELRDLQREQEWWMNSDENGEAESISPFDSWMDGLLAINRVTRAPMFQPDAEPELLHWELLLAWGGPGISMELRPDGSGVILAAWWGPTYRLDFSELDFIATHLEAHDEAIHG